jgi:ATP-dependent Lhr-like helicase
MPIRSGPPTAAGRWSLLPTATDPDGAAATVRMAALAESLLERHGVVTRGAVAAERVPGGFAAVYRVLSAMEEAGRCRRVYAVEGLGAAQFALPGAVDRLRAPSPRPDASGAPPVHVLSAADPANPYGAALPWPERPGHRPGRKAGAVVVLVDGALTLYVERGGRSLLTFGDDPAGLAAAAGGLARAVRDGVLGRLTVERADGAGVHTGPVAEALAGAGFVATPRGLRLRA